MKFEPVKHKILDIDFQCLNNIYLNQEWTLVLNGIQFKIPIRFLNQLNDTISGVILKK